MSYYARSGVVLFMLLISSICSVDGHLIRRQNPQATIPDGASATFTAGSPQAFTQAKLARGKGAIGPKAKDGSSIVIMTAEIDNYALQFKISAPAEELANAKNGLVIKVVSAPRSGGTTMGAKGVNVLLHGDGGENFFEFPNQGVQNDLMGVVILAPNDKRYWGGGGGDLRSDGVLHAKLVNTLVTQVMRVDESKVYFTGISGGSLLLAGFFLPLYAENYNTGVLLGCGALPPQVPVSENFGKTLRTMRIHFQTSQEELTDGQPEIAGGIVTYAAAALTSGATQAQMGKIMTADATPNGDHCAFDGKSYTTGVQFISSNYANIIFGNGYVPGLGNVATSVYENDQRYKTGIPVAKSVAAESVNFQKSGGMVPYIHDPGMWEVDRM